MTGLVYICTSICGRGGSRRGGKGQCTGRGAEGSIGVGLTPGLADDDTLTLLPSRCPKVKNVKKDL